MSKDVETRLREEAMRLSGHSLDRSSVDAGIAANLADEAADTIEKLRGKYDALLVSWDESSSRHLDAERRLASLSSRYEDWKPVSEAPHPVQIERREILCFYGEDADGTYWNGTWEERAWASLWCRIVSPALNDSARALIPTGAAHV